MNEAWNAAMNRPYTVRPIAYENEMGEKFLQLRVLPSNQRSRVRVEVARDTRRQCGRGKRAGLRCDRCKSKECLRVLCADSVARLTGFRKNISQTRVDTSSKPAYIIAARADSLDMGWGTFVGCWCKTRKKPRIIWFWQGCLGIPASDFGWKCPSCGSQEKLNHVLASGFITQLPPSEQFVRRFADTLELRHDYFICESCQEFFRVASPSPYYVLAAQPGVRTDDVFARTLIDPAIAGDLRSFQDRRSKATREIYVSPLASANWRDFWEGTDRLFVKKPIAPQGVETKTTHQIAAKLIVAEGAKMANKFLSELHRRVWKAFGKAETRSELHDNAGMLQGQQEGLPEARTESS